MDLVLHEFLPRRGRRSPWNATLERMLVGSGAFAVRRGPCPVRLPPDAKASSRESCVSFLSVGGVLLMLDTWDCDWPTSHFAAAGYFDPGGPLAQVRAVLKIQWRPGRPAWTRLAAAGVTVTPWTMFPSSDFPLGAVRWGAGPHRYLLSVSGASRRGRGAFVDCCAGWPDCHVLPLGHKDDRARFLDVLARCRWGLSLKGRSRTDGKNRREPEFASCGIPLALNYRPHYPFPFRAGEHYVYLAGPDDVAKLRDIDPAPFALASRELWDRYFSPVGMASLLTNLVNGARSASPAVFPGAGPTGGDGGDTLDCAGPY